MKNIGPFLPGTHAGEAHVRGAESDPLLCPSAKVRGLDTTMFCPACQDLSHTFQRLSLKTKCSPVQETVIRETRRGGWMLLSYVKRPQTLPNWPLQLVLAVVQTDGLA